MSQKTKIISISAFILIILILGTLFLVRKNKKNVANNNINSNQPFNSFNTNSANKNQNNNTTPIINTTPINWVSSPTFKQSRFYQITDFAIAGAAFTENTKPIETVDPKTNKKITTLKITPLLRYVERQTGHIYQMNTSTKESTMVSNTTVPSVHKVLFNNKNNIFIYRYLSTEDNTITSFIASLGTGKSEFLPLNISEVSLSPDKNSFFYLVEGIDDKVTGFIKSFNNTKITQVFRSSFTEWLPQLLSNNRVFLTTKPSWRIEGTLFSLNTKNETLNKLLGGVLGLTTLANNDGSYVLYSSDTANGPDLFIFNTQKHTSRNLNLYSLPEKCTWDNNNIYIYCAIPNNIIGVNYPDSWYQGLVSFNDYFVKINPKTAKIENIANSLNETPVDGTSLFLDKSEKNLFFTNKKDSTLWGLSL